MLFVSGQNVNAAIKKAFAKSYAFDSTVSKATAVASYAAWRNASIRARACCYRMLGTSLQTTPMSGAKSGRQYFAQSADIGNFAGVSSVSGSSQSIFEPYVGTLAEMAAFRKYYSYSEYDNGSTDTGLSDKSLAVRMTDVYSTNGQRAWSTPPRLVLMPYSGAESGAVAFTPDVALTLSRSTYSSGSRDYYTYTPYQQAYLFDPSTYGQSSGPVSDISSLTANSPKTVTSGYSKDMLAVLCSSYGQTHAVLVVNWSYTYGTYGQPYNYVSTSIGKDRPLSRITTKADDAPAYIDWLGIPFELLPNQFYVLALSKDTDYTMPNQASPNDLLSLPLVSADNLKLYDKISFAV